MAATKLIKQLFSPVWIVRLILIFLGVWGLSFAVSDYVVKANTSSTVVSLLALQSSIDRLDQTLVANNTALLGFQQEIAALASQAAVQSGQISQIKINVETIKSAVQAAEIPAVK